MDRVLAKGEKPIPLEKAKNRNGRAVGVNSGSIRTVRIIDVASTLV